MKIIVSVAVVIIFFYSNLLSSQTLKGTVLNENGSPIVTANILIKEAKTPDAISEFTIARNGKFEKILKKKYDTILIEVKANGYFKSIHIIKSPKKDKTYSIDFYLKKDSITKLEEVVVIAKRRPFTIKKDTVKYHVKSYLDGSERKIEDVIKKLPGIEVNEKSGEIKYKGKSVETVLLEGDNLFGYNYSLGTKNINVDMVEEVQAIENYSENPLLKGIESGRKVALNLKLKKGKIDLSGNVDLGSGFFEDKKQALNIYSTILGITKNYKSFSTLSYNNVSINHSPFDYFGFNVSLEQLKEKDFFAKKIIPETSFYNVLDDERVNVNNQYFGNHNALFKIENRLKIKTNWYYINDKITSEQLFENQYTINEKSFTTRDEYFIKKKPTQYRGDLEIKYNTSKTSSLKYNLRIRQENIKTPTSIISTDENNFESFLKSEDFYLKQKLLFTKKLSKRKALQFLFLQSTNFIPQTYRINPSVIEDDNYNQDIQKSRYAKNYIEVRSTLLGSSSRDKYTFLFGGIFDDNHLKSELYSQNKTDILSKKDGINDLDYTKKSVYQLGAYHFNFGKWKFSPTYSFSYLKEKINDDVKKTTENQNGFIFEPSLRIKYRLNSTSFLSGKVGYNEFTNANKYLFQNQILINNRTTISNTPSLKLQKTSSYGISYLNNDLYNQLQINLGINYQNKKGNFFTNSVINRNATRINYFYLPQNNSNLNFNLAVSKFVPFIESTVKLSSNYYISEYKNIVNNSDLRSNRGQFLSTTLFFKTAFRLFINFENTLNLSESVSKSENSNKFFNKSVNNSFKIILKPSKKWFILLSSDYFLPDRENKSENYMFLDISLRYRPKNKRLEFNFVAKNLLNKNNFQQVQTSDFSTNIYRTNILPRYYFLNMTYNF